MLGHQAPAPVSSGTLSQILDLSRSWMMFPSLGTTAQTILWHSTATRLLCQLSFFLCRILPGFIYIKLSLSCCHHTCEFDVMQELLFLFSSSATAVAGCPCQSIPISQGSLQRPTSLFLPAAGSQAALREADLLLRSAVRKKEQKL